MSPKIRSYSDAINSYELSCHTSTGLGFVSCYDYCSLLLFAFFVSVNLVKVTDFAYSLQWVLQKSPIALFPLTDISSLDKFSKLSVYALYFLNVLLIRHIDIQPSK